MRTFDLKEIDKAFEYYYNLGKNRKCANVGLQFNVSENTVKLWSKKFNWQEQVKQRDMEGIEAFRAARVEKAQKEIEALAEQIDTHISFVRILVGTGIEKVRNKDLSVESIEEIAIMMNVYCRLAQLKMKLYGIGENKTPEDGSTKILTIADVFMQLNLNGNQLEKIESDTAEVS